jgi:hypothetical protein
MSNEGSESNADANKDRDVPGLLMTAEMNKDAHLPVPEKLRPLLFMNYQNDKDGSQDTDDDAKTLWGYEENLELGVLSSQWPSTGANKFVGSYGLNGGSWITLSDEVAENTGLEQEKGALVYFFTYGDMMDEGEAYVLSELQAWRLLPVDELPDDEGLREVVIRDEPGFMSSIR